VVNIPICKECGKEFTSLRAGTKYCSIECKKVIKRQQDKKWRDENKEHRRIFRKTHRPQINAYHKKYYHDNPWYRLAHNFRRRIQLTIKGQRKAAGSKELLGCTWDEFKKHIEKQWTPGMSWDNYGNKKLKNFWEIDHIKPCAVFDKTDPMWQFKCFHYTNQQPLWWIDNIKKGAKYEENNKK
jgi:hypothetical protein